MIVKICGTTNLDDALAAAEAGADLLGFIFYPRSPRYVAPALVAEIVREVRAQCAAPPRCVGVFVNTPLQDVQAILAQTNLDLAQLHGDESVDHLQALAGRGFKAIRPTNIQEAMASAAVYAPFGSPWGPQLLIDAYHPHLYGGGGRRGDWEVAAAVAQQVERLLLAGGLTPETVTEAVRQVKPWGVDVASGVEAAPGRKDPAKLRAFIAAAKTLADLP